MKPDSKPSVNPLCLMKRMLFIGLILTQSLSVTSTILWMTAFFLACSPESFNSASESLLSSKDSKVRVETIDTELKTRVTTRALHNYDEAPRTPDVDDPAIWNPRSSGRPMFVIATLKNAGLEVYDADGKVLQTISPFNRPAISAKDPPAPGVQPEAGTTACPGSKSGKTFGRFNNVDIAYDFELVAADNSTRTIDIAVVSDRGCDRLWVFEIDPGRAGGPLFDISAPDAPRTFPQKLIQPSPVQSPGQAAKTVENPVDDQDTAYGLDVFGDGDDVRAVVSQEHRSTIGVFELYSAAGKVSYRNQVRLNFPNTFQIANADSNGIISWTACREESGEDLQFEGLVVDEDHEILYATQEVIGVWAIDLDDLKGTVNVSQDRLVERVKTFGAPFFAIPNEDEFECLAKAPAGGLPAGSFAGPGNPKAGGKNLEADVEGATLYYEDGDDASYLIVSSQGSNSFQVYDLEDTDLKLEDQHIGAFEVKGVGSTDGLDVSNADLGGLFNEGMLVIQNGDAPPPASTDPINGFEYDGSSQMIYLRWADIAKQFKPNLKIEP